MPRADGMPRAAGSNLESVLELYEETDNKGNMIHGEAPTRIIQCDRSRSCFFSAKQLIVDDQWAAERIADDLNRHFDLVVYSTANAIRPNFDPGTSTVQLLDALKCDFIVLGMGLQSALPATTQQLHPNLASLLTVCDKKSLLFGVRGLETQQWLHAAGFGNARALGCPSLYVYPRNVLAVPAPDASKVRRAVTGGHIHGRVPRSTVLTSLFRGFEAHYVMQEEIPILIRKRLLEDAQDIYNDATGELNRSLLVPVLEHIHRCSLPFASYRWFQDPNAWRSFAAQHDFYLGDRLHGGVVALQCGVPAVMIAEDRRVAEIADFFGIPKLSLQAAKDVPLLDIVDTLLSAPNIGAMKETYSQRLREFVSAFRAIDIKLGVSTDLPSEAHVVGTPLRSLPPPGMLRRVKDRIAQLLS